MVKGRVPELTLGDRLMLARKKKGIESADMAAEFKKSRHTITNWEVGRSEPSYSEIQKWSEITGYDVEAEWRIEGLPAAPVSLGADQRLEAAAVLLDLLLRGRDSNSQPTDLAVDPDVLSLFELDLMPEPPSIIDLREKVNAA